ncbi:MAG: hypothetical protein AB1696_06050 [Planctomycetota bacterium]
MNDEKKYPSLTLRPYLALCVVCSLGEGPSMPQEEKLNDVLRQIRENPDMPVALRCNAGDVYVYQDRGIAEDTPESVEFNRKRDLDILAALDLAPGSVLPARTLFHLVLKTIPTARGICCYDAVTSDAWRGCPRAGSGCYEKGREKGTAAIISPRGEDEMAKEKEKSLAAMYAAEAISIRPHILLCAVCQYGGGTRPPFKPDNLPEFIQHILKNPDTLVALAEGADWMMCAPCPRRVPELNACVNVLGSGGLSNQKRDLDVLQVLGLCYGSTMKAKDLYRLIFERIPTTREVCRRQNLPPSVWWDGCGENNDRNPRGNENYEKGREMLKKEFELI